MGIGLSMGGGSFDALYLCIACALSSTVIIVKVLYEKRELDTLPGRITLGVLVLQDIFAILFLAVQPSLANLQVGVILLSIGRVGVLVATALVLSRYVLPRLFHQIARRPELILLGALAWCFLIGEIAEKLPKSCICRAKWDRWWPGCRSRHFPMRSTLPPRSPGRIFPAETPRAHAACRRRSGPSCPARS
jgi:Kef-type K+ transport system membrane component KefB